MLIIDARTGIGLFPENTRIAFMKAMFQIKWNTRSNIRKCLY